MIQYVHLLLILGVSTFFFILLQALSWWTYVLNAALLVLSFQLTKIFFMFVWSSWKGPTLTDLDKRAVVVTGCDTGFGNQLARKLDAKGVTVFAGCLFAEGPDAKKLKQECSERLHVLQLDVTKDEQVKAVAETVEQSLGDKCLHAVVNNAGITTITELEYMSFETMKTMHDVNTFGLCNVTQAFLPLMNKSKGRLVYVASAAGTLCVPFLGSYCMSKHAVLAYASTLRKELMRWSISVHIIEPFIYLTNIANPDVIMKNTTREFNSVPEEIRKKYGEGYLDRFQFLLSSTRNSIGSSWSKTREVVECLEDATIGKYPKLRYTPGFFGKLQMYLVHILPEDAWDLLCHAIIKFVFGRGSTKKVQ